MPVYNVTLPRTGEEYSRSDMDKILRDIELAFQKLKPHVVYGGFYQYEVPTTIAIAVQHTYYLVTGNTAGELLGMSFASDALTVGAGGQGHYIVTWSMSFSDGGNTTFEGKVFINGAGTSLLAGHTGTSGSLEVTTSASGIVILEEGDVVDLRIVNHTGVSDPIIEHVSLVMVRIGGG